MELIFYKTEPCSLQYKRKYKALKCIHVFKFQNTSTENEGEVLKMLQP